ncbi:MAG: hypothetical protein OXU20_33345 [Myxococcales bacterium]|nr:hypothetical protein [Myxococcales bacterium]
MLTDHMRLLYARQLLLPEIGGPGQERLCDATFSMPEDVDPTAAAVAHMYLTRAGLRQAPGGPALAGLPACDSLALGEREAAYAQAQSALSGALSAVERIKQVLELPGACAQQGGSQGMATTE